jgi:hypothetical protein
VAGTAIFSEFDSAGNLLAEAGVPSAIASTRQAIFVDTINSYNIGIAYANPGSGTASIKLDLLNSSAQSVLSTTLSQVLGPGNHTQGFTFQMFPTAPSTMAGTMQISSDTPLAAIALRFDPTLSKFTTLPPVNLASLINPALEWLQQREWLTPLTLLRDYWEPSSFGLDDGKGRIFTGLALLFNHFPYHLRWAVAPDICDE